MQDRFQRGERVRHKDGRRGTVLGQGETGPMGNDQSVVVAFDAVPLAQVHEGKNALAGVRGGVQVVRERLFVAPYELTRLSIVDQIGEIEPEPAGSQASRDTASTTLRSAMFSGACEPKPDPKPLPIVSQSTWTL